MVTPDQPSPIVVEELHNDTQRALATTINEMIAEGLRGDDALDRIVEDIQPAVLFHPDVRPHAKFYRQVRDIFVSLGVHVESKRGYPIIIALACVFPEGEFRDDALAYLSNGRTITAQPHREANTTPSNDATYYTQRDSARAVGSVLNMYKDVSSKYGGTIKENFQEAFDKYSRVIEDLQISSEKGLQILHNMLTGEALSFYSTIRDNCQTITDAHTLLEAEFMSAARQNAARRELDSLLFRDELAKADTPIEALESIRTTITRVITQCPERYRGEKFRIDFLRRAIQSEPWAADPIARADGDDHTFTQFYNNVATRLTLARIRLNQTLPVVFDAPQRQPTGSLALELKCRGEPGIHVFFSVKKIKRSIRTPSACPRPTGPVKQTNIVMFRSRSALVFLTATRPPQIYELHIQAYTDAMQQPRRVNNESQEKDRSKSCFANESKRSPNSPMTLQSRSHKHKNTTGRSPSLGFLE